MWTTILVCIACSGAVNWSSTIPTRALFSLFWSSLLQEFVRAGKLQLVDYCRKNLITWQEEEKMWTGAFWNGICCPTLVCGLGTSTCFQSLERWNGTVKTSLGDSYWTMALSAVAKLVESAIAANGCEKGWLENDAQAVSKDWRMEVGFEPCKPFMTNSFYQADRDVEEDLQRKVPGAAKYYSFLPNNVVSTDVDGIQHLRTARARSLVFDCANDCVDEDTHGAVLKLFQATSEAEAFDVLRELECVHTSPDGSEESLQLSSFRDVLDNISQVWSLRQPWSGCIALCTCRVFAKCGTCAHELLCRWMDGDKKVSLVETNVFTEKAAPANLISADNYARTKRGRPISVPKRSAWSTMNDIIAKAKARAENRKRKADDATNETWRLFRQGLSEDKTEEGLTGPERARKMERMVKKLESDHFHTWLAGLLLVESLGISKAEAAEHGVLQIVHAQQKHHMRLISSLARRILRRWSREAS
eukprot:s2527_g11.t1